MKIIAKIVFLLTFILTFAFAGVVVSYAEYTRVSESVNLREKPSTDSKILGLVPMGYEITVLGKDGGWTKITFEGSTGYVKSEFIEVINGTFQAGQNTSKEAPGQNTDGSANNAAESGDVVLRYGSEGNAVRELQKLLTEKGMYEGPINGKFGPLTENALMKYQEIMGLEIDGAAGSETMKKLTQKPHPAGTYRQGDEGEGVINVQKKLKEKNYYNGPVNGKFGPLTEEAVKRFQSANGLETDGIAGKVTLDLLNAPPKSSGTTKSTSASSGSSGASGGASAAVDMSGVKSSQTAPNGVELIEWSVIKRIFTIGADARIYDVRTGAVYYVRSFSNGNHADVEPVTVEDTETLKKTYGGVWSWDPRPVWVTINGRTFAGSINGMPHGGGVNSTNGMNGQVCLHFLGGSTHNSNKAYAQLHQNAVIEAWNAARG